MNPCPSALTRTGALAVVFGTAFGLVLGPAGLALAEEGAPSTVRALLGEDGSVRSVDRVGSDEAAPGAEDMPVTVAVAEDGDTTSYTVENTTVQKQTVNYLGADGKPTSAEQDVALPLVAQLAVRLPASRTDVVAPGARITKLSDGSSELVWSLVLFGPIGSPVSEVSFTSGGSGDAVARLDVAAVQPNATPGLSATGQAANATVNGNGILNTVANGANEGLVKLSAGVGELLAGLDKLYAGAQQLNEGIAKGADGARQLADGSAKAKAGSGELSKGLGELAAGATKVSDGAGKLDVGAGKIMEGLGAANEGGTKLADGSAALAAGSGDAAAGAKQLSEGLTLISGGLDKLSAAQGLPAALDGAKKLQVGVDQLRAGLGAPATEGTILNGVAKISGGLTAVNNGVGTVSTGLTGAAISVNGSAKTLEGKLVTGGEVDQLVNGAGYVAQVLASQCASASKLAVATPADPYQLFATTWAALCAVGPDGAGPIPGVLSASSDVAVGTATVRTSSKESLVGLQTLEAGLWSAVSGLGLISKGVGDLQAGTTKLDGGLKQVAGGLESGDPAKPGVAEGLDALVAGLTTAVGGVGQLATGAQEASAGSVALAEGNQKIADGAGQVAAGNGELSKGLTQLYTGSQELKAGTGALSTGSKQLADGAGKAAAGSKELDAGLAKIADGQKQVADGLPAAVDGSGQIADGLGQVVDGQQKVAKGLTDVKSQAVEVLMSQFEQGTELARQQLAGLDAASAMIASTPGAATTTWVLTQNEGEIDAALVSDASSLGRNAAIGVGGALLLMTGIAGGYISGRRKALVQP